MRITMQEMLDLINLVALQCYARGRVDAIENKIEIDQLVKRGEALSFIEEMDLYLINKRMNGAASLNKKTDLMKLKKIIFGKRFEKLSDNIVEDQLTQDIRLTDI